MKFDYYEELEISSNASIEVIKVAYKRLALKYHPDNKETGDEAKFKRLNEAHDVLSDEGKREEYNRKRKAEQETQKGTQENQEWQRREREKRQQPAQEEYDEKIRNQQSAKNDLYKRIDKFPYDILLQKKAKDKLLKM